jgi:ABC-type methionine transport system permease subunit
VKSPSSERRPEQARTHWIVPNGYQWFVSQIMLTVVLLLVAVIQLGGDRLARGLNKR